MRLFRWMFACLATVLVLAQAPASAEPVELKVMIFNIWRSGVQLSLAQVVAAIRAADPDVVALQEPEGNSRKIADMLGWSYVDERVHLISRVPLFAGTQDDVHFSYVEVRHGEMVAIANLHLPSDSYGPEAVRDGKPLDEVLQLEADNRMYMLEPYAEAMPKVAAAGIPVIVGGDFNSPSHLDWTEAVAKARPAVKYPVVWPESKLMADKGFVDSYRAVHADPVAKPGLTWTPGYPHPFVRPQETHDRIDYIYAIGANAVASRIVGEGGGPDVDIAVDPWPADHRALVTTFEVEPAPTPDLITVEPRLVKPGEVFVIRVATQKQEKLGVFGVYPAGAAEDAAPITSLPCRPGGPSGRALRHGAPGARRISGGGLGRQRQAPGQHALLGHRSERQAGRRGGEVQREGGRSDRGVVEQRAGQQVRLDRHLQRQRSRSLQLPRLSLHQRQRRRFDHVQDGGFRRRAAARRIRSPPDARRRLCRARHREVHGDGVAPRLRTRSRCL